VFKHDFAVPSRGRPLSPLSIDSWHLHVKGLYGWRNVAKELIPEEYLKSPDEAAKKVRKAAASFISFRRSVLNSLVPRDKRLRRVLEGIVWLSGLQEIAWRAVGRKFEDAIRGAPERLSVIPLQDYEPEL
jgi:hypothetical protein